MSKLYVNEIRPKTSGGAVTFPEKPTFKVGLSADTSIANGSTVKVNLDDVDWNVGNHWDTANYQFKPSVAGYYMIIWHITINSSTPDYVLARIYKNGVLHGDFANGESNAANMYVRGLATMIIHFNGTSDYIDFRVQHNVGSATNAEGNRENTSASGFLIG